MQWDRIEMLIWLWFAALLLAGMLWQHHRQRRLFTRFAHPSMHARLSERDAGRRLRVIRIGLLTGTVIVAVLALARPQWGFEWQEVKREGIDIMLAVDASKSMLTPDIKPSRLERTKLAVKDLVKALKGDRIGLIGFAGDAFLLCPLTVDYNGFLMSLNELSPDTLPRGGTNLSSAIEESMKAFENTPSENKAIVIVTDGENLEGEPLKLAEQAREQGVRIYTIGVGTREGELIRYQDPSGENVFLRDEQGNVVKSRLNEGLLQQIARTTGGAYARAAGTQFGLELMYRQELSRLTRREFESRQEKRYYDRFYVPLAMSLLLLIGETCLWTRKRNMSS